MSVTYLTCAWVDWPLVTDDDNIGTLAEQPNQRFTQKTILIIKNTRIAELGTISLTESIVCRDAPEIDNARVPNPNSPTPS